VQDNQADVAEAFGTDGEINAFSLVVLEDDKDLFPPYQVAPWCGRKRWMQTQVHDAPQRTGSQANRRHDATPQLRKGKQREPAEVAKEFLTQAGC